MDALPRTLAVAVAAVPLLLASAPAARCQSLSVVPVNIELPPGQMTSAITVVNQGNAETSIQVRAMAWEQADNNERLVATDDLLVSPPIATVPPGASQIVRLVLRRPPLRGEATYRLVLDQIPPAAAPGTVRVALRLSIPVFAQSNTRGHPQLKFQIEQRAGQTYLAGMNSGDRHDKIRDVAVFTSSGRRLQLGPDPSPYVLAGATNRRQILAPPHQIATGDQLRVVGNADTGPIDQPTAVTGGP